jgi:sec-independent protein translocase protein TatA
MFEFETVPSLILAFMGIGMPELLIVAGIFVLLFGGAKLPGLMRNLGRSVNEFKEGIKEKPTDSAIEDASEKEAV